MRKLSSDDGKIVRLTLELSLHYLGKSKQFITATFCRFILTIASEYLIKNEHIKSCAQTSRLLCVHRPSAFSTVGDYAINHCLFTFCHNSCMSFIDV